MIPLIRLEESTEASMLASRILAPGKERIVVSSCEDGAGKTTLCRILASYAIHSQHREVVYVDMNLRHPTPPETFSGKIFSERFLFRNLGSDFGGLEDWEKRNRIEESLRLPSEGALVIVDTSPIGIFNRNNVHPANLSQWSKELVLVVAQEGTRHSQVVSARNLMASHGITIAGAVLNLHAGAAGQDSASVTQWRSLVHGALRMRREIPMLRRRLRNALHGFRAVWRLLRPGIRRSFNGVCASPVARFAISVARRLAPATVRAVRNLLSRARAGIDRMLRRGERWWTRN